MTKTQQNMARMFVIIPSADMEAILVVRNRDAERCDLPGVAMASLPVPKNVRNMDETVAGVAKLVGLHGADLSALRHLGWYKDKCGRFSVVETENMDDGFEPPSNYAWAGQEEAASIADPRRRAASVKWFAERGGVLAGRAPWEVPGWRREALAWIDREFARLGLGSPIDIEGRKTGSSWGCVLRIETEVHRVFFKAVREWTDHEPRVTERLAILFPGRIPEILSVEEERGWLLVRSGGEPLWRFGDGPPRCAEEQVVESVRQFAILQSETASHVDTLLTHGCPDRRMLPIEDGIARVFVGLENSLSDSGYVPNGKSLLDSLLAAQGCFEELLVPLGCSSIPDALVHPDFHPGNIALDPSTGRFITFDWEDCSIGHPFISLRACLAHPSVRAAGCRKQVRAAYLDAWREWEPMAKLDQLADIAEWIRALNQIETASTWLRYLPPDSPAYGAGVQTIRDALDTAKQAVAAKCTKGDTPCR